MATLLPSKDAFHATARALGARAPTSAKGVSDARRAMAHVLQLWAGRLMDAASTPASGQRPAAAASASVSTRAVRSALSRAGSRQRRSRRPQHRGGEGALGHTVLPLAYFGGPGGTGEFSAEGRYTQRGGEGALGHTVLPPAYFGRDEGAAYSQAFEDAGHTAFTSAPCIARDALVASPGITPLLSGGSSGGAAKDRAVDLAAARAYIHDLVLKTAARRGVHVTPKAARLIAQHLYAALAHGVAMNAAASKKQRGAPAAAAAAPSLSASSLRACAAAT